MAVLAHRLPPVDQAGNASPLGKLNETRAKALRPVDLSSPRDLATALDLHRCSVRACAEEMGVDEKIPRQLVHGERSITTLHIRRMPADVALTFLELLAARIRAKALVVDVEGEVTP